MGVREPTRLLGYLVVRRPKLLAQGEVLSTIGLAWVLREASAASLFGRMIGVDDVAAWEPEAFAEESGRPDIVGLTLGEPALPVVVVEAKIHHQLSASQLNNYLDWQDAVIASAESSRRGLVVLLVPAVRRADAIRLVEGLQRQGRCLVCTWEDVFDRLDSVASDASGDVAQLIDLYRQYESTWVSSFTPNDVSPEGWRSRIEDYRTLAQLLSAEIHNGLRPLGLGHNRLQPMQDEGYRYIVMGPTGSPNLAIGLFRELSEGVTFGLRYHKDTRHFETVRERLDLSSLPVERALGHRLVRLKVPVGVTHEYIMYSLRHQVIEILTVSQPEMAPAIRKSLLNGSNTPPT
jgi:hypothetical protein